LRLLLAALLDSMERVLEQVGGGRHAGCLKLARI
jgi:hypothetical protein